MHISVRTLSCARNVSLYSRAFLLMSAMIYSTRLLSNHTVQQCVYNRFAYVGMHAHVRCSQVLRRAVEFHAELRHSQRPQATKLAGDSRLSRQDNELWEGYGQGRRCSTNTCMPTAGIPVLSTRRVILSWNWSFAFLIIYFVFFGYQVPKNT